MADRGGFLREGVITYAYILLYMALSSGQFFFNKIIKAEEGMSVDIYITSVIHIGAMFAMTLWLGNTAYLYISAAFAQMLKAIMPVAVFILGVAAGLEMGGVVGEALRLIFLEIFVKKKGLKLNTISVMYYVNPCCAICLFIPWICLEKPKMDADKTWNFQPAVLILNSLCTFALNLLVFLVITHISALTIRVAGVVKEWAVVLVSALLFVDTKLTMINLVGYGIGSKLLLQRMPMFSDD